MVFFTCSYCGESVKKPSVTKHYQTRCKNKVPFLTCVDCLKDFKGNEHEAHTKCVTEEERYSAKGFVPKPSSNKGERKQKAWSECAQGLLSSGLLEPEEKTFLEFIARFDNLPRKKAKFMNFVNSSARNFMGKIKVVERVWEKLDNYFKESNSEGQKSTKGEEESGVVNGKEKSEKNVGEEKQEQAEEKVEEMEVEEETKKKKKKRKKDSVNEGEVNGREEKEVKEENGEHKKKKKVRANEVEEEEEPKSKKSKKCEEEVKTKGDEKENIEDEKKTEGNEVSFDWKETVLSVISGKGEDNKIPLKKLQKKVVNKYCKVYECQVDDKVTKKFMKKLKKMSEVTVDGDFVSLNTQ